MSFTTHNDNKKGYIDIRNRSNTRIRTYFNCRKDVYSIKFTEKNKEFCLSLHYNGANGYLFVNSTEVYRFKAKDSKIVARPLSLGNISKDWSTDNMKKTGLNGYVYDLSVDYKAVDVDDIKNIHRYLMKKNNMI